MKLHIRNQTDFKIDLCCGLDQELTLRPEREATVEVQDGDFIYIDQIEQMIKKPCELEKDGKCTDCQALCGMTGEDTCCQSCGEVRNCEDPCEYAWAEEEDWTEEEQHDD